MNGLFPDPSAHDPGGKALRLPLGVYATAVYGGVGDCYRYRLDWTWDLGRPRMVAGLMNPSTAGHRCGDATVAWVRRWASARGFGAITVINADAYRCTDQARLAETDDPMGPDNPLHILQSVEGAALVVLGYGLPKVRAVRDHGIGMAHLLHDHGVPLHVWRLTKDGHPQHPLYLPADTEAVRWTP